MTETSGHTGPARGAPDAERLLERARIAGDSGKPAQAVALCRRALAAVRRDQARDDHAGADDSIARSLHVRIVVTLSFNLAELGQTDEAIQLLGETASMATPDNVAALQASRGLIYARIGDVPHAMQDLDTAIATLTRTDADQEDLARTLLNRGVLLMSAGNLVAAQADTSRAEAAATAADADIVVFMARYNLGYLRFLTGDLPGSLHAMAAAEELAPEAALGVPALDRARVLLAAGLLTEARDYATSAITTFTANRAMTDLTDALLVGADVAIAMGDPGHARTLARRAARVGAGRGAVVAELLARLVEQRANAVARRLARLSGRPATAARARAAAAAATALADGLEEAGRREEAVTAHLLAVEGLLDAGDVDPAAALYRQVAQAAGRLPLAGRLQGQLMAGRVALASGRRTEGLRHLRRGLDDLGRFQALFGSQDLQSASAIWGRQLTAAGLRAAVDTRSPAQILQWLERSRATSTRLPHIRPPEDPALRADLGALRLAEATARSALLAGRPDPEREREIAELRRRIRARSWTLSGSGRADRPLSLAAVQRALAEVGSHPGAEVGSHPGAEPAPGSTAGTLGGPGTRSPAAPTVLAYFHGAGYVHALSVTATAARYHRLAPLPRCEELIRVLGADLDLLSADRVPPSLRAVASRSLAGALEELSDLLVAPILAAGDGEVLISGAGPLSAVPWPLLPALTGTAASVTTSVSTSIAGLGARPPAHRTGVLAVAGPGLDRADQEVKAVVEHYRTPAATLTGPAATGAAVLGEIPAGGVLHIAAHGHHEPDSPLFSSVVLADGPLFAYDIAPNRALPDQVVLSSCDVGRMAIRDGGEPLGLATALLRSGVRTVVAAVAPVSDRAAAAVMSAYHAGLAAGAGPAAALAAALPEAGDAPAAFSCFGSGGSVRSGGDAPLESRSGES